MGSKIAYVDCHNGIRGDLLVAALIDAGADWKGMQQALRDVVGSDIEICVESLYRNGIQGHRFMLVQPETQHYIVQYPLRLIQQSNLTMPVRTLAIDMLRRMYDAQEAILGRSVQEDAIDIQTMVEVISIAWSICDLALEEIYVSSLPLTGGYVLQGEQRIPIPSPVTLEILRRVGAIWFSSPSQEELVTPVGAAFLATKARFTIPPFIIERIACGLGDKQVSTPDCVRLYLGQLSMATSPTDHEMDVDWVSVIETHIDDMQGELLGAVMERLLELGALDVAYVPLQMKKNRPAVLLRVICSLEKGEDFARILLHETTTLGVRIQQMQRRKAQRVARQIRTPLGLLWVKVKLLSDQVISAAPEYEDCRRLARSSGLSLREVYEIAQVAIEQTIMRRYPLNDRQKS